MVGGWGNIWCFSRVECFYLHCFTSQSLNNSRGATITASANSPAPHFHFSHCNRALSDSVYPKQPTADRFYTPHHNHNEPSSDTNHHSIGSPAIRLRCSCPVPALQGWRDSCQNGTMSAKDTIRNTISGLASLPSRSGSGWRPSSVCAPSTTTRTAAWGWLRW